MARATTKAELMTAADDNFKKLFFLINTFTMKEQQGIFPFEDRDKNIRDVLVHLYEWHQLLLKWVNQNQAGKAITFLPAPYNWKTYPEMNVGFWRKHQQTSYEDSIKMLQESHDEVMKVIENFSNEELFTKKYFSWTGTTSLGSYCVSATSSHYDWAMKKIKKYKKTLGKK